MALTDAELGSLLLGIRLSRTSAAYMRMTEAGFKFDELEVRLIGETILVESRFVCVCGRTECFSWQESLTFFEQYRGTVNLWIDVAWRLEKLGAVSVDHLRADGYGEEAIERIRAPYRRQAEYEAMYNRSMRG